MLWATLCRGPCSKELTANPDCLKKADTLYLAACKKTFADNKHMSLEVNPSPSDEKDFQLTPWLEPYGILKQRIQLSNDWTPDHKNYNILNVFWTTRFMAILLHSNGKLTYYIIFYSLDIPQCNQTFCWKNGLQVLLL